MEVAPQSDLPDNFTGDRSFSTAIYFLLNEDDFSTFHRIKSDEIWHFYDGTTIKLWAINENGNLSEYLLGRDLDNGEVPLVMIPKNTWFAAEVVDKKSYGLVGCTVSPGFHFDDFEMGQKSQLLEKYTEHSTLLERLCR